MSFTVHLETAAIIPFPSARRRRSSMVIVQEAAVVSLSRAPVACVVDDCWYHEDAINEPVQGGDGLKPC